MVVIPISHGQMNAEDAFEAAAEETPPSESVLRSAQDPTWSTWPELYPRRRGRGSCTVDGATARWSEPLRQRQSRAQVPESHRARRQPRRLGQGGSEPAYRRAVTTTADWHRAAAVLDSAATVDPTAATVGDLIGPGGVVVLTGAGMSTDSGIPDYRSPGAPTRRPMTHDEFRSGPAARQRYWARSHLGWQRMRRAAPNAGHRALVDLEHGGITSTLITQNVDGLHGLAGSRRVIDLHGRIDEVICLDCRQVTSRLELQDRMTRMNPDFDDQLLLTVAPDGDADLEDTDGFRVPGCRRCTGVLKPRVVFFGDSVPKPVVQTCYAAVDSARMLLVAGSSLTVMSGLRFVRHAAKQGKSIVIINRGPTRGDQLATVKLESGCSETLTELATHLC